jgi:uncharacterized membrane protein SpoIIM required for sporulation
LASRDQFVLERQLRWNELEAHLTRGPLHRLSAGEIRETANLYRAACADLMHARARSFGTDITGYLDTLVSRGHSALYGPRPYSLASGHQLLFVSFPRTLRRHAGLFAVATALFVVPLLVGWVLAVRSEEFAFAVMPKSALEQAAAAYSKDFSGGRDASVDASMAGFYVQNNVGIAFRCFATGVLFGAGTVFFLFYNGLAIGTTFGFVTRSGGGGNIVTFACSHGPFELTAIVIAGTAGLLMGHALIATGGLTRWGSLRRTSSELGDLVLGAAAMLLVAAAIEGFWSPSGVPPQVKWAFSGVAMAAITLFLAFAGRSRAA